MSKNSLCDHIRGCQHNLLPITFPRLIWHASTILRLSRRLYNMEYHLINRLIHLINSSHTDSLHYLRSIHIQTRSISSRAYYHKFRMTKWMSSTISYIRRTNLHSSKIVKKGRNRTLSYRFQANIIATMSFFMN